MGLPKTTFADFSITDQALKYYCNKSEALGICSYPIVNGLGSAGLLVTGIGDVLIQGSAALITLITGFVAPFFDFLRTAITGKPHCLNGWKWRMTPKHLSKVFGHLFNTPIIVLKNLFIGPHKTREDHFKKSKELERIHALQVQLDALKKAEREKALIQALAKAFNHSKDVALNPRQNIPTTDEPATEPPSPPTRHVPLPSSSSQQAVRVLPTPRKLPAPPIQALPAPSIPASAGIPKPPPPAPQKSAGIGPPPPPPPLKPKPPKLAGTSKPRTSGATAATLTQAVTSDILRQGINGLKPAVKPDVVPQNATTQTLQNAGFDVHKIDSFFAKAGKNLSSSSQDSLDDSGVDWGSYME